MPPASPPRDKATGRWQDHKTNPRLLMGLFPVELKQTQRRLLGAYLIAGTIREAARIADLSWTSHYHWTDVCPAYAKAFQRAQEIVGDKAEDSLHERGVNGYDKPISYKGQITAWYKEFSDVCLVTWLKANKPTKYRDSLVNFTSNAPASITIITSSAPERPIKPAIEGGNNGGNTESGHEDVPVITTG